MGDTLDILMIEDEANIAEAVRFILIREGWRIAIYPEGTGALAQIRDGRPRLVILDLMLPGRSGVEILADLRAAKDAQLASTPVLLLTARSQPTSALPPRDDRTLLLAKPFSNDELRQVVRDLLSPR